MQLNVEAFLQTLPVMAKGMAGILLVTAVIIALMYLLNRFGGEDKDQNGEA